MKDESADFPEFAELSINGRALLLSCFGGGESLSAPLNFLANKEVNGASGMKPSDELQNLGWLIEVKEGKGYLSEKAKGALETYRHRLGEASISDSRIKHVLATAYAWAVEQDWKGFDEGYVIGECNLGDKGIWIIRQLRMQGYFEGKYLTSCYPTEKAKEIGKTILGELRAKQKPQDEKFSGYWTNRTAEGKQFMRWAWRQHRGDLNKSVDARAYATKNKRNFYDLMAILDWTREQGFTEEREESKYINKHAINFWDAPINETFPHEFQVNLTADGEAFGSALHAEHKARFKRWGKSCADVFSHAKTIITAVIAIMGAVTVYWAGYHKGASANPSQPTTTQAIKPASSTATTWP